MILLEEIGTEMGGGGGGVAIYKFLFQEKNNSFQEIFS